MRFLNETKIEWADRTWNPVVGCRHGCTYCYAEAMCRRFARSWGRDPMDPFKPEFYRDRLDAPSRVEEPLTIFAVSMGDLFGKWVPIRWILDVFQAMEDAPQHTFLVLTKEAERLENMSQVTGFPENLWVGVSVDTPENVDRLSHIMWTDHEHRFVSFEPLLEDVTKSILFDVDEVDWIIIGAETGPRAKPPKLSWVHNILREAPISTPTFVKDNIIKQFPHSLVELPQDFPPGLGRRSSA